jgi:hypothetical protein
MWRLATALPVQLPLSQLLLSFYEQPGHLATYGHIRCSFRQIYCRNEQLIPNSILALALDTSPPQRPTIEPPLKAHIARV